MRRRPLGQTGLQVSELALGCMAFGPGPGFMRGISASESEAQALLDEAVDRGVNLLDTADVYQKGQSEMILGRWMQSRRLRQRLVLATKVGGRTGEGPCDQGLSRRHLVRACEASLGRLRTDVIDLYQVHWPDAGTPLAETLEALGELRQAGKIRFAGCSNFPAWLLAQALGLGERSGGPRFCAHQVQYSLLVRHVEREILPLCIDQEIAVLIWSPLASGLLAGRSDPDGPQVPGHGRRAVWWRRYAGGREDQIAGIIEQVREVARRRQAAPATVALSWIMRRPGVTSCIMGARTRDQLRENLAAAKLLLAEEETEQLDRVSALLPEYPGAMMSRMLAGGPFWDE